MGDGGGRRPTGPALVAVGFKLEFVENHKLIVTGEGKSVACMGSSRALLSWK